jgi:hypothetical protein
MAKLGLATGKPDKNKKASSFNQATGQLNYAFKMGDTYYTYDWAQPIGGLLAAGADAYNAGKDEKSFISGLGEGMVSAGDTVVKQSFLQGIFNLMSGYSPTSGFINAMAGSTTQAIPTSSKQIAQLVDPYVRDTSANGMGKEMLNKLAVRVPFVSKTLPKRVDVLGRDIRSYGGDNNIFNVLLNPGFTSKGSLTSGQKMIKSLFERTGETDILPRVAPDYFSYNGKKYTLTVEEKNEMQRYMGVETQKLYDRMSNIDSSDTAKIKSLKTSIDRIYEKAKADIVKRKVSVDAHDTLNKLNDAKLQIESSSLSKSEKALKLASINAAMIELAKKSNLMYDKNN